MKKYILSILMILTTAGCFAGLPNMKYFNGKKGLTNFNEVYYAHASEDGVPLYRTGTFKSSYLENYDPLTKCTYTVYGLFNSDDVEPFCIIEDFKGNFYISSDYLIVEKKDHTIYYFSFSESKTDYRFNVIADFKSDEITGYFQTFQ